MRQSWLAARHRRDIGETQRALLDWVLAAQIGAEPDVADCLQDLVASMEPEPLHGLPPPWLTKARERLIEDPGTAQIDALALASGVHRSHFARAFQHWFGTSPSLFRRRAMLSRAIAAAISGECLAAAALHGGFADQSHLCRTMRKLIGTTPDRLLRRA